MLKNEVRIQAVNLTKKFGNTIAIKALNLKIYSGEIFAFLGPNGAGKTTTVKIFSGLIKPTAGSAFICGYDISKNPIEVKKLIGLLPDHPFIYPKLTGLEYLQLITNIYKVDTKTAKNHISELIEIFDLKDVASDLIETYSLGMRQKLIIASILMRTPEVFLLDEPLVGLDPKSARIVKDIFVKLARQGKTIFMCTHILETAEKLADRIGVINHGELIMEAKTNEIQKTFNGKSIEDIYLSITSTKENNA